jgi:NADPH2:quinone reductase
MIVSAFGGPEMLGAADVPEPEPGPGEVSVTVRFAGVNYTDVRNRQGDGLGQPPFIPGVEVSGTVRAVGAGVTSLRPGQPVAAFTRGHGYAEVATAAEAFTVPVTEELAGRPESAAMLITVPLVLMLLRRVARGRPHTRSSTASARCSGTTISTPRCWRRRAAGAWTWCWTRWR